MHTINVEGLSSWSSGLWYLPRSESDIVRSTSSTIAQKIVANYAESIPDYKLLFMLTTPKMEG